MENKENRGGVVALKRFFKKNLYYILLIVSLIAIGTIVTLALVLGNKPAPQPDVPSGSDETKMIMPIQGEYTVARDYSVNKPFWFSIIKRHKAHTGIDLAAEEGTPVVAVLDGVVEKVDTNNILDGDIVVIKHSDSLTTTYMYLKNVTVKQGDSVKAGDKIGEIAPARGVEKDLGAHLHFEVSVNGDKVNPNDYLTLSSDK
ncbi:MAG TPA: M23 family metallopeptidase [Clostridia bacterium]